MSFLVVVKNVTKRASLFALFLLYHFMTQRQSIDQWSLVSAALIRIQMRAAASADFFPGGWGQKFSRVCLPKNTKKTYYFSQKSPKTYYFWPAKAGQGRKGD